MPGPGLGPWGPLTLAEVVEVLANAPFRWWVTGGLALELHLSDSWRDHGDTDVGIRRHDAPALHRWLAGWDVSVAANGRLSRWHGEDLDAAAHQNNLWCRRHPEDAWRLDVVVGAGTDDRWIYRRDETITRPWPTTVLHTHGGIPYLAPEIQLLFKSTGLRDRDHLDARVVLPRLDAPRRAFLEQVLPPGHPWQALLQR